MDRSNSLAKMAVQAT